MSDFAMVIRLQHSYPNYMAPVGLRRNRNYCRDHLVILHYWGKRDLSFHFLCIFVCVSVRNKYAVS